MRKERGTVPSRREVLVGAGALAAIAALPCPNQRPARLPLQPIGAGLFLDAYGAITTAGPVASRPLADRAV